MGLLYPTNSNDINPLSTIITSNPDYTLLEVRYLVEFLVI